MTKILFITHETSRTGAPFVLLYFLQWLKSNKKDTETTLLSLRRGDLHDAFKLVVDEIHELSDVNEKLPFTTRALNKAFNRQPTSKKEGLIEHIASKPYDVIYSNTILAMPYGNTIKAKQSKAEHIVHVHELNAIIKMLSPNFGSEINSVDHFIAASDLVKNNLITNWTIPESKITRVYECSRTEVNSQHKNSADTFHVGGSGTVHWRKGSDLFIQVANYIKTNYLETPVKFTWVGHHSDKERIIIEEDVRKMELQDMVTFTGQQENPQAYFNDFDIFLMTSREDPFPLVCIEVGMLGKPIVCFKGATGSEEVISKGGGVSVPYLDVKAMTDQVMQYYNDRALCQEHGVINQREFSQFTPELICPQYYDVIETVLNSGKS
ncbi:MAG: glycosyltransferase [Bacteroidota bacterium]